MYFFCPANAGLFCLVNPVHHSPRKEKANGIYIRTLEISHPGAEPHKGGGREVRTRLGRSGVDFCRVQVGKRGVAEGKGRHARRCARQLCGCDGQNAVDTRHQHAKQNRVCRRHLSDRARDLPRRQAGQHDSVPCPAARERDISGTREHVIAVARAHAGRNINQRKHEERSCNLSF